MMVLVVLRATYCKVQSLAVMFQFAGFDYCTPKVAIAEYAACVHGLFAYNV